MFQIGDSILLKDGSILLISFKNGEHRVTIEKANELYKKGEVIQKTNEEGFFVNVE